MTKFEAPLWHCLTLKEQEDIKKLYKKMTGKDFKEPIESSAELEKQMKIPTKWKKKPK